MCIVLVVVPPFPFRLQLPPRKPQGGAVLRSAVLFCVLVHVALRHPEYFRSFDNVDFLVRYSGAFGGQRRKLRRRRDPSHDFGVEARELAANRWKLYKRELLDRRVERSDQIRRTVHRFFTMPYAINP